MELSLFTALITLLSLLITRSVSAGKVTTPNNVPKNAILLSNVESLTLRAGKMTTSRRVSAVPQLNCVGPQEICKFYTVDVMRCQNEGADYDAENIQWACKANLPEEFKLGGTEVACEGYASSDDPYVLKGSCGVNYRLLLTEKGEEKYGRHNPSPGNSDSEGQMTGFARVVFFVIFTSVLFIIVARLVQQCQRNPPRLGGNAGQAPWYGGGGGGDDGGNDDPPPPYDSHSFNNPGKYNTSGTRSYGTAGSSRNAGGWRPGPWTAGLTGAGLGYALGRNQNRTQTGTRSPPSRYGGGGSFFGDGDGAGPSNSRSSEPSFSSSRYESTGFGGTSRR
ncbi:hypothetical protein LTS08_006634 [Lithohypha guttulata]|nr:hypothetical protein LTS08_006634 [Lithohypha guttulata]